MRLAIEAPHHSRSILLTGPGIVRAIPETVEGLCGHGAAHVRTTVVTGPGFADRPWSAEVRAALRSLPCRYVVQAGVTTPHSVLGLARTLRAHDPDVVIAIGGGSVIDAAKAARVLSLRGVDNAPDVVDFCARAISDTGDPRPALIAVPTTPGTGAEVTPYATIWNEASRRKLSLSGHGLVPHVAVLDPDLLVGSLPAQWAAAALDTLCQGAEAAWSIRSTPSSITSGVAAVQLVGRVLDRIGDGPPDRVDRQCLQLAGHYSGRAIAEAPTSSCHALSYPLTMWFDLPHGHACGVSLGRMLCYNAAVTNDCVDPRGAAHVRTVVRQIAQGLLNSHEPVGEADVEHTARSAAARVERLLAACHLARLSDLPLTPGHLAVEAATYPRLYDNPRRLDIATLTAIVGQPSMTEEP
jgi:alcohol dehydrogenase class IV